MYTHAHSLAHTVTYTHTHKAVYCNSPYVCRCSQNAGRNSCSIVSGNVSNCSYRLTVYPVTSLRLNSAYHFFLCENIQNYSEYRVAHASGQLNRTSDAGNCGHGSSPPTSRNGNELSAVSGDNILWSRLIASGPSERRQHERRREFIPSRLENVVKELVRIL